MEVRNAPGACQGRGDPGRRGSGFCSGGGVGGNSCALGGNLFIGERRLAASFILGGVSWRDSAETGENLPMFKDNMCAVMIITIDWNLG